MIQRRRFNAGERAALYLAADGRCERCARELAPGWHADHMTPHAAGGPTDVINGQALCPRCNLLKGSYVTTLRGWQLDAIDKYNQHTGPDFMVSATPGAGKTTFALALARQLLDSGRVQRIAIVVPTDPLRRLIQKVVDAIEDRAERAEVQDLLDQALQGQHGGDRSKKDNITLAPGSTEGGTSRDAALRRLRKDAPGLHAEVLAGNLTAHGAMVKAGFRVRSITVRPDAKSAARTLRKHMDPEQLAELARLLSQDGAT